MSSEDLRDAFRAFTTSCALITTAGPRGPNVMAAEWTFNVSYRPFLILVAIDPENRTHGMILESKEFGVNLVAEDQVAAMGFAGHYSKADTDKLSSEVFPTYPAKRIHAPLIRGAVLSAECRLVAHYPMGDHTGFLGEVVEFSVDAGRPPLVLHRGSHRLGERILREPALLVAATPMRARPGDAVLVTGELTGPSRADASVEIALRNGSGKSVAEGRAVTDSEGSFRAQLEIPPAVPSGSYVVMARSVGLEGFAHLDLQT